jgi:hypothetical protein
MIRPRIALSAGVVSAACLFLSANAASASAAPTVRTASGADAAAITPARDAYRADLGGGTTAGQNGSFGGVRREINWDGVPEAQSSPNPFKPDFFNTNSPRGAVFETPGSGFQVSSDAAPQRFGNINPNYSTLFKTFSPQKLFTPTGSNVTDVKFFVPGTTTPASVSGFGSVFADVGKADATSITYYDENGNQVDRIATPTAAGGLSFVGASYNDGTRISRVRIVTGNTTVGPDDSPSADVVVMDDFLYGEPQEIKPKAAQGNVGGQQQNQNQNQNQAAAPAQTGNAALDTTAPRLSASVRKALNLASLRKGLTIKVNSDEPASLDVDLLRGRTVLATKHLGVGSGARSIKLKLRRSALAKLPRHAGLKLRVKATDQAGNTTVTTKRISVTR